MTTLIDNPNTTEIELDVPLTRGKDTFSTLTVTKPTTGTLRGLKLSALIELDVDVLIKLIPRVVTPALTEQETASLDASDFVRLGTAVVSYLAPKSKRAQQPNLNETSDSPTA